MSYDNDSSVEISDSFDISAEYNNIISKINKSPSSPSRRISFSADDTDNIINSVKNNNNRASQNNLSSIRNSNASSQFSAR